MTMNDPLTVANCVDAIGNYGEANDAQIMSDFFTEGSLPPQNDLVES